MGVWIPFVGVYAGSVAITKPRHYSEPERVAVVSAKKPADALPFADLVLIGEWAHLFHRIMRQMGLQVRYVWNR